MGCLCPRDNTYRTEHQPNQQHTLQKIQPQPQQHHQNRLVNLSQNPPPLTPIPPIPNPQLPQQKRQYLTKDKLQWNQMMIMIASSARKQNPNKYFQSRDLNTLEGVNYDIDYFMDKFKGYITHCIQSAEDEGILLSKKIILNMLEKLFKKPVLDFYLFYSGHGFDHTQHINLRGSIVIQKQKNKSKNKEQTDIKQIQQYIIDLDEIIKLWNKNKLCQQSHLYIFLDSCYSGEWCNKLSKMDQDQDNVSIFASCSADQLSRGYKGGLFFKTLFQKQQNFQENYQLLEVNQKPVYIRNSKIVAKLTKNHIKLLQKDIKLSKKLKSSDPESYNPQIQIDMSKYEKNKSSNSVKIGVDNFNTKRTDKNMKEDAQKTIIQNIDGDKYEGQVKNGLKQGKGIYIFSYGDKYQGQWKKDKKQGKGIYEYAYGGKYIGQFKNDKKQGKGTFHYVSGAKFEGTWKNDNRQGKGFYIHTDGRRIQQHWKNNIKII